MDLDIRAHKKAQEVLAHELTNDPPYCWMMVGPPCSGKSTFCRTVLHPVVDRMFPDHMILQASTDDIITDIADKYGFTYNESHGRLIDFAHLAMGRLIEHAITEGVSIIWDQTNVSAGARIAKLKRIPKHYIKVAIVASPATYTFGSLQARNIRRGKIIPALALQNMCDEHEKILSEGDLSLTLRFFDKLIFFDSGNQAIHTITK